MQGSAQAMSRRPTHRGDRPGVRGWRLMESVQFFLALAAIPCGAALAVRPDGSLLQLSPTLLTHSPFRDYFVPGLILMVVVGGGNLLGAVMAVRREQGAELVSAVFGAGTILWTIIQFAMIQSFSWLQVFVFVLGVIVLGEAMWLWIEKRERGARPAV